MSRTQQDSVIDDDEETCPLCIEEFDLSDRNFKPCPCGYQICQFCFNSLKITYEKSNCPNCRRPYDEKTIQYKIPTAEEFKLDLQNKTRKQAAAKRKETEKREVETSGRRNLAGVRVKQTNLVYVIGLIPTIKDEAELLQKLRGTEYFGQYGEIEKIVVSKAKASSASQGIGVYVTYAKKEDAALCIQTVDGSMNGERVLRAQYGTTKYCSAFLRGEVCNNKTCSFLHDAGEDGQTTSIQNEPNGKVITKASYSNQPPPMHPSSRPTPPTAPATISEPMARQSSKEGSDSRNDSIDASALPSSASWANANAPVTKVRRTSQAASNSTSSPLVSNSVPLMTKTEDTKTRESANSTPGPPQSQPATLIQKPATTTPALGFAPTARRYDPFAANKTLLNNLLHRVSSPNFRFVFDESAFSAEELAAIEQQPILIDPYGGAKRRMMIEKEKAELEKQEAEAQANSEAQAPTKILTNDDNADDENVGSGSLALGGEPEEDPRGASSRGAIQRPQQTSSINNFINEQFSNMNINGRTFTPQQRQQAGLTPSNTQRAPGLNQSLTTTSGPELFDFDQRGLQFSNQSQYDPMHTHQRQNSRYFNSENSKPAAASRFSGQQQFYSSGVQGPPPGLATAGTPPISGGGMFAHGQGFTSSVNTGFGSLKEGNADMHRGRSGTNDISKREFLLSSQNNSLRSPPLQAPAPGLLNTLYGQYAGAYQDPGLVKQKKKGKKHRHANTSSSGGGVVDLADPSILQARVHQGSASTGQGLFGGNQVDEKEFPALPGPPLSSTPKIPPGFDLSHSHPSTSASQSTPTQINQQKPSGQPIGIILPAVPLLPIGQRAPTPKSKLKETPLDLKIEKPPESAESPSQDHPAVATKRTENISLGSPKPKAAEVKAHAETAELKVATNEETLADPIRKKTLSIDVLAHDSAGSRLKTDVPSATATTPVLQDVADLKNATPVLGSAIVGTPPPISSRPSTPATPFSEVSRTSIPRPRTIRVTTSMTRNNADTAPPSAVTEKSMTLPSSGAQSQMNKQAARSRAQSITSGVSQSRPSTPAMSDRFSMTNDMLSRANSPPASIVGSALERTKTKAQQKKERKEKAKKATETSEAGNSSATANPSAVEEVAPLLGRQRKVKKHRPVPGTDDAREEFADADDLGKPVDQVDDSRANSKDAVKGDTASSAHTTVSLKHPTKNVTESKKKDIKKVDPKSVGGMPAKKEDPKPARIEEPLPIKESYTLLDLYTDSARNKHDPMGFQKLLNEHISSMSQIFGSLLDSKEVDANSALFGNLPSLNSAAFKLPPDSRKGAEYLDANGYTDSNPFGQIYLGPKEKKALWNGESFGVADEREGRQGDLLRRALVTGGGVVYRHLSREQEDKVMELEARKEHHAAQWGRIGTMNKLGKLEDDDYTNIEGGVEDLIRHGDRHGIGWVMGQHREEWDEDADADDEDGDQFDDDYEDEDEKADEQLGYDPTVGGWEVAAAGGVIPPALAAAAVKQALAAKAPAVTAVNLRALDNAQLQRRIGESQREIDAAKKEMEKIEKLMLKKAKEVGKWREGISALKV